MLNKSTDESTDESPDELVCAERRYDAQYAGKYGWTHHKSFQSLQECLDHVLERPEVSVHRVSTPIYVWRIVGPTIESDDTVLYIINLKPQGAAQIRKPKTGD